jgi:hypothetical protein
MRIPSIPASFAAMRSLRARSSSTSCSSTSPVYRSSSKTCGAWARGTKPDAPELRHALCNIIDRLRRHLHFRVRLLLLSLCGRKGLQIEVRRLGLWNAGSMGSWNIST